MKKWQINCRTRPRFIGVQKTDSAPKIPVSPNMIKRIFPPEPKALRHIANPATPNKEALLSVLVSKDLFVAKHAPSKKMIARVNIEVG